MSFFHYLDTYYSLYTQCEKDQVTFLILLALAKIDYNFRQSLSLSAQ